MYVLSACFYIAGRMFISTCFHKANEPSDMNKAVTDFIVYANINLTWFAFNFVLVTLPAICIFFFNSDFLVMDDRQESYLGIIYTLWSMHMVAFLMKARIYYPK